eukprot:GHRR01025921.1.p1 GENE.GHRR01025921.1~~GHRR01025921.1.p1  ORF type:complete len:107 (+),score=21.56 GHRR01025921.1:497-817(+)
MRPFAPAMPCVRRFSAAHLHLLAPAATRHPDTQEVCTTTSPLAVSMGWAQKDMKLPAMHRGCHLITHMVMTEVGSSWQQFVRLSSGADYGPMVSDRGRSCSAVEAV